MENNGATLVFLEYHIVYFFFMPRMVILSSSKSKRFTVRERPDANRIS